MSPSWSLESLAGSCRSCFPRALQPGPGLRVGGVDPHGAAWRPQEDALCDREHVPSQRLPHACFPQTGSQWGLVTLFPCPRSSQRPSLMALGPKDSSKACACRPAGGLLHLDGFPASHKLGETTLRLPPHVALAGVLSGPSGARGLSVASPPVLTALDD